MQLAEAQMEYEEFRNELNKNEDNVDLISLREKYDDALEIIQQLKNEQVPKSQAQSNEETSNDGQARLERLAEENLELREVVDHLVSITAAFALLEVRSCSHLEFSL